MNTEFLNPVRDRWSKLAPGERRLAKAGGAVLGMALLYLLLWMPMQKELARLRAGVPEERAQLQQMRAQADSIKPLRARTGAAPAAGMLLSVVDQSASARGVRGFISRLELDGSTGVQLTADAVPFNTFISWLAELQDSHALVVENASMDAHSTPGTVNVKMKLRIEAP
jgi:general secretion pathway protein M